MVEGRGVGRKLGFPTANVDPHHEVVPPSGVYAVNVLINRKIHRGILNIGRAPTFEKKREPTIELHVFNFKRDIYKKDIEIVFKRKIRNEKRFDSVELLKKQIRLDIFNAL